MKLNQYEFINKVKNLVKAINNSSDVFYDMFYYVDNSVCLTKVNHYATNAATIDVYIQNKFYSDDEFEFFHNELVKRCKIR